MKRDRWRMLSVVLVLLAGIGLGMSFPWGRAQEPSTTTDAAAGEGSGKSDPVKDQPASRGRTPADAARERVEIVEEDGRFTLTAYFPNKTDPKRTRWKITCSSEKAGTLGGPRESLLIHYAFFQPAPEGTEIQVLGLTYLAESMVAYSDGVRYYDIGHHTNGLLKAHPGDLGDHGFTLDRSQKIICEVRNRGLHWKVGNGDHHSRRGEELVVWATIKAANYLYVIHFGFHDDGTIQTRMGSTGSNLTSHIGPEKSHTHIAFWRVDVDFGDRTSNEVHLVRHREPWGSSSHSTQITEAFNGGRSGFADWTDKEFTVLRIVNPKMKGAAWPARRLRPDLPAHRLGTPLRQLAR